MSQFTPLNVEQSVARHLADKFIADSKSIYWQDSETTEGAGDEVTLLREFPPEPSLLIKSTSSRVPGTVKVPAFTVVANAPTTSEAQRIGIGESLFEWTLLCRIEGFAEDELQWYLLHNQLKDWFNPDTRISLYDYQADINSESPALVEQRMHLNGIQVVRRELNFDNAARYYLALNTNVTFIE